MVVINTLSTSWHLAGEQMHSTGQWLGKEQLQIQILDLGGSNLEPELDNLTLLMVHSFWRNTSAKLWIVHFDSHQHSWADTMSSDSARGAERMLLVCVQLVSCVTPIYWHIISYYSQRVALTFSWRGDFLHCTHRSWKSNIPLWQQRGEVMNNLRFSALALPSLRKQSACCLGRWLENVFIAVMLASEGGRWEWGRGRRGGGSHTSLPALPFPWVQVPVAHLLSLSHHGEWWSFENSSVWLGFKIHSAGHESLSITISKILFLYSCFSKVVWAPPATWAVKRGWSCPVIKHWGHSTEPHCCAELQEPLRVFAKGTACPLVNVFALGWAQIAHLGNIVHPEQNLELISV